MKLYVRQKDIDVSKKSQKKYKWKKKQQKNYELRCDDYMKVIKTFCVVQDSRRGMKNCHALSIDDNNWNC